MNLSVSDSSNQYGIQRPAPLEIPTTPAQGNRILNATMSLRVSSDGAQRTVPLPVMMLTPMSWRPYFFPTPGRRKELPQRENIKSLFSAVKSQARSAMIKKLDPEANWSFAAGECDLAKMKRFLLDDKLFGAFYEELTNVMSVLTETDMESIRKSIRQEGEMTENVQKFIGLFKTLDEHGFNDIRGRKINFWSGNDARIKALNDPNAISDSKVPAMNAVYAIASEIMKKEKDPFPVSFFMMQAVSAVFAMQATDEVDLYFSNNKDRESLSSGMVIGNIFWMVELPTLRALKDRGTVTEIFNNSLNQNTKQWHRKVYNSDDISLPRTRPVMDDVSSQFPTSVSTSWNGDFNRFRTDSQPRQHTLTVGAMKNFIFGWHMEAQKRYWSQLFPKFQRHGDQDSPTRHFTFQIVPLELKEGAAVGSAAK